MAQSKADKYRYNMKRLTELELAEQELIENLAKVGRWLGEPEVDVKQIVRKGGGTRYTMGETKYIAYTESAHAKTASKASNRRAIITRIEEKLSENNRATGKRTKGLAKQSL